MIPVLIILSFAGQAWGSVINLEEAWIRTSYNQQPWVQSNVDLSSEEAAQIPIELTTSWGRIWGKWSTAGNGTYGKWEVITEYHVPSSGIGNFDLRSMFKWRVLDQLPGTYWAHYQMDQTCTSSTSTYNPYLLVFADLETSYGHPYPHFTDGGQPAPTEYHYNYSGVFDPIGSYLAVGGEIHVVSFMNTCYSHSIMELTFPEPSSAFLLLAFGIAGIRKTRVCE